jgi:hypothetical protein
MNRESAFFVPNPVPMQTGDLKTHMTQSQAGLGTQGPVISEPRRTELPPPKDESMPDA